MREWELDGQEEQEINLIWVTCDLAEEMSHRLLEMQDDLRDVRTPVVMSTGERRAAMELLDEARRALDRMDEVFERGR